VPEGTDLQTAPRGPFQFSADRVVSGPAPVRGGGAIKQPIKTRHVNPVYPPIAQSARVQGVVIMEIVITPEGQVQDARVLRSIPLLDQAALDAVRQWEFTPTLLNGAPTAIIMTVTVQFSLPEPAQ
jgi:protein TonB